MKPGLARYVRAPLVRVLLPVVFTLASATSVVGADTVSVAARLALAAEERDAFAAFERWWELAHAPDADEQVRRRARRHAAVLAHLLGFRGRLERLIEVDPEDPELAWLRAWLAHRAGRATGWFWEPGARQRFGRLPVEAQPCSRARRALVCPE